MALYIGAYGLTMPRLLPCVFMAFPSIVFISLIALQKWDFSIVRLALVTGAIIICTLSLSNPDAIVVRYNTSRFISGTLQDYDMEILQRAGSAGVLPALQVYEWTDDEALRQEIRMYILFRSGVTDTSNAHTQSLESQRANEQIRQSSIKPLAPPSGR
jgi:hypothetical protein